MFKTLINSVIALALSAPAAAAPATAPAGLPKPKPVPLSPWSKVFYGYADAILKNGRDTHGPQKTGFPFHSQFAPLPGGGAEERSNIA